ncbi:hypothetical protein F7725_022334 [Dissostichus mawsoni]|uniref:Dynein axonemal assembly factor 4 n=1 Tax=Dissostichus mawsoni TaxID=36200 RepID=A0A7J5YZR0_DISMA|nr:hypothetical protein F7725_022334 [Dissostichus mawsoni]
MPLIVTDYSWTQTDSTVFISVPLKGARAERVDFLSTEEYLKVHYPPYLFEAFLSEPVDEDRSTAKVGNGVAVITLTKCSNAFWEHLMIKKRKEVRERALLKYQERLCSESRSKAEKQQAEKKYALETMMKLEKEERDRILKKKEDEREKTTAELAAWQLRQRETAEGEAKLKLQDQRDRQNKLKAPTEKQEKGCSNGAKMKEATVKQRARKPQRSCPLRGALQTFKSDSPRAFSQPRSGNQECQRRRRRAGNADVEELKDLREEERNPEWLKDKGDKCFASGDFLGAVNAYNLAIRLHSKIPALHSNRAACHLKLKNLHKAIEDASQALDLLTQPSLPTQQPEPGPASAGGPPSVSYSSMQKLTSCDVFSGLQDYQAALKLDPHNAALQADTQTIRDILQGSATGMH